MEDNNNIWQGSKYLSESNTNSTFILILKLIIAENNLVTKNYKIAAILSIKFFPPLLKYSTPMVKNNSNQLSTLPIIEMEIQDAIFQARILKRVRHNRILTLVWQKTWPILKDFVMQLF